MAGATRTTPSLIRVEVEQTPSGLANLVRNPSGLKGAWGWVTPVTNTNLTASTTPDLTFKTTVSQAAYLYTERYAVAAGQYVSGRVDVTALTASHNIKVRAEFLDSTGAVIGSTAQSAALSAAGTAFLPGGQAPANTVRARFRIDFYNGTGNPSANATVTFRQGMLTKSATNTFPTAPRTNLVPNPSFETGTLHWTAYGSQARSTAQAVVGTYSLLCGNNSAANTPAGARTVDPMPITGGQTYTFRIAVRTVAGSFGVVPTIEWYTSAGDQISTVSGATVTPSSTGWTIASVTATSPTNAALIRVNVTDVASASPGNRQVYLDAAMVEPSTTVGAYFDGSSAASGKTYAWTGTAHDSSSTETASGGVDYVEPVIWQNIAGPSHEISIDTSDLDSGLLSATIVDPNLDPAVATLIRPGKKIRVSGWNGTDWTQFYEGTLDNPKTNYVTKTVISVTASNNIGNLANTPEPLGVATVAELPFILEGAGVPWNCGSTGGNQVASATVVSANSNASLLDQVAVTRDTDQAYAWIDRFNVLQVQRRADLSSAAVVSFSDVAGSTFSYSDIDVDYAYDSVINAVTVTWLRYTAATGALQEITYGPYVDQASIDTYGVQSRTFKIQGATEDPAAIATYAQSILTANSTPEKRPHSLKIPVRTDAERAMVCALNLYDSIAITYKTILAAKIVRITSIKHNITDTGWTTDIGFDGVSSVAQPQPIPTGVTADAAVEGKWQTIGAAGQPAFLNGWANYDANRVAQYMRLNGVVYLRGVVKNTVSGTPNTVPMFQLPVGYRPASRATRDKVFPTNANAALGFLGVQGDGNVYLDSGNATYAFLDPVAYPADA